MKKVLNIWEKAAHGLLPTQLSHLSQFRSKRLQKAAAKTLVVMAEVETAAIQEKARLREIGVEVANRAKAKAKAKAAQMLMVCLLCLFSFLGQAQTKTVVDAAGNVKLEKIVFSALTEVVAHYDLTETGKTLTDTKGRTFPIYQTKRGSLVYIRQSRNGGYVKVSIPKN